jgi:hypothetical protein
LEIICPFYRGSNFVDWVVGVLNIMKCVWFGLFPKMPPLEALILVVEKMSAPALFPPYSLVYVVAHDLVSQYNFTPLLNPRGVHSLLYFAYTCVRDLFIGGVIYLAKKIIR